MERKNFIKNDEDFTCEHCGHKVAGSGYTNHCSQCLYSKHVDNVPGDRMSPCGGLMAPVGVEYRDQTYSITHKCLKCGHAKKNKLADDDDFDRVIELSKQFLV